MTRREEEILRWIEENPMISQQELAEKAGITRSSVAVHISNLMKKGYIAGKGYVLQNAPYAVVVGGLNKDIGGKPLNRLIPKDSNLGKVNISIGGVGRNIAHNMSLLGVRSSFLTALGDDEFTSTVTESCSKLGIDISHALKVPGMSTSTYLFIADETGDMELAISDMEIFNKVTPDYLAANLELINKAELVVADTNIPQESLEWLADNIDVPLFIDPVSTIKAKKLKNMLGKIHTLKPNRLEAEILTDIEIVDDESLKKAAKKLLKTGLKRVFISLGAEGVIAADSENYIKIPCPEARLVNTTGGGDAFMAGIVWAFVHGKNLKDTALLGSGAASVAVESTTTINSKLTIEEACRRARVNL